MRRFITSSLLVVAAVATALACGPWGRPTYYMFSVYNRNQMGETYTKGLLEYWSQYVDAHDLAAYEINYLGWVSSDEFDTSDNKLIATARDRRDTEMLDYLRLLCSYLREGAGVQGDDWSYPTKEELQKRNSSLDYIYNRARSYQGTRLAAQYELLALRTLLLKQDWNTIATRWNARVSKMPASVFRDMSRGIYAAALLNTGKRREACEIYAELGDMRSLKWVVRDQRNLQGIKQEYAANPNSPTLVYLVQDYVNNAQSTIENLASARKSLSEGYTYDGFEQEVRQIEAAVNSLADFVPFAQQVVKEKKTQVPAMWLSAAGHLQALLGNNQQGISLLDQSLKLKGTQRMLDNARMCRLMATLSTAQPTKQYKDYLQGELQWITERERQEAQESRAYGSSDNHYTEMLQNLCYDYLSPRFRQLGETNLATALIAWCDSHCGVSDEREEEGYTELGELRSAVDLLTADQAIAFKTFVASNPSSKLEQYLQLGTAFGDDEFYAERIGTKMLREGRFEEAVSWLEQVSTDYIGTMAISAYMSHRTFEKKQWFERQRGVTDYEEPTPVSENQKLAFARAMISATERVRTTGGMQQAQAKYDLAALYFIASYKGNCWYLTRYGNSYYDDGPIYENEVDYVAEAVRLLTEASAQATGDVDLLQRCLYANAYIPYGEPYVTYEYDANYRKIPQYHPDSHEYTSLLALAQFKQANGSRVASYVSRCDVLKKFMAFTF